MRVVAGKLRGRTLIVPKGDSVRPTTTRIKETLFNVLQGEVEGAKVLDLFAGSGALGIECISRGAEHVTFADVSKISLAAVKENLRGVDSGYDVVNSDCFLFLNRAAVRGLRFDLIFLDPPYASGLAEKSIDLIISLGLLNENGIMVYEHGSEKEFSLKAEGYVTRTKKMGTITAEFIRRAKKADGGKNAEGAENTAESASAEKSENEYKLASAEKFESREKSDINGAPTNAKPKEGSIVLMTGSFDPFTKGHEAVLDKALRLYDNVVVGCFVNPDKKYMFSGEQRLKIAKAVCAERSGAEAAFSDGYVYEFAKKIGADVIIRGVRTNFSEDEWRYEREMEKFNADRGIKTEFITPDGFGTLSSTAVREQLKRGDFSGVPSVVSELLKSGDFISAYFKP